MRSDTAIQGWDYDLLYKDTILTSIVKKLIEITNNTGLQSSIIFSKHI